MSFKRLSIGLVSLSAFALADGNAASAAVLVSFDDATVTNPFRPAAVNTSTSFSGSVTDPAYQGGTSTTLTFSNPRINVNITTPTAPNTAGSTLSTFGAEGTGMGVGDTGLGRFTRGEQFTLTTTDALTINKFVFHEWNGDEDVHIAWTEGGMAISQVFVMTPGTGTAPSNVTVTLSGVDADANSSIVFTNVSATTDNSSGRLRFRKMEVALIPEPTSLGLLAGAGVLVLRPRRKRM